MIRAGMTATLLCGVIIGAFAQTNKNIVDVVSSSVEHKTLAKFMQVDDPMGQYINGGFYTVFAPNDAAMNQLPKSIIDQMRKPENVDVTHSIINYHILAGKYTQQDILAAIKQNNGHATFKTIQGGSVTFSTLGNYIKITDQDGHVANIRFSSVAVGNGMVHTIDKVLMPRDEPQSAPTTVAGY